MASPIYGRLLQIVKRFGFGQCWEMHGDGVDQHLQ